MQVLPQALPTWQILQHVWAVEPERAVELMEDEGAQRLLWMADGSGRVAVVDDGDGDSAKAAVVSDRKRMRTMSMRGMGSLYESERNVQHAASPRRWV